MRRRGAKTMEKARKLVYSFLSPSKQGRRAYSELKGGVVICVSNPNQPPLKKKRKNRLKKRQHSMVVFCW